MITIPCYYKNNLDTVYLFKKFVISVGEKYLNMVGLQIFKGKCSYS